MTRLMTRLTITQYDQLRKAISERIKQDGYVRPTRNLADELHCSPVTAWRIVRSLGWSAKGHRWVEAKSHRRVGSRD